jgi:uncharacterized protein YjbJ (UPF0337 family)
MVADADLGASGSKGRTTMGNQEQAEGKLEQARGTVKEGLGDTFGNEQMEREGQYDQAKGHVREGVGDLKEGVEDAKDDWNRDTNR